MTIEKAFEQYKGQRVLLIGIGGGGDIAGTIPTALQLKETGAKPVIAGITWKRKSQDYLGRPRPRAHFTKITGGNETIWYVTPETKIASTEEQHIEARIAAHTEFNVASIYNGKGVEQTRQGIQEFCSQNKINAIIGIDVGGDVLCYGNERETLRSPMCDQIMLAALAGLDNTILGVTGLGTDGEITIDRFMQRLIDFKAGYKGARTIRQKEIEYLAKLLQNPDVKTECTRLYLKNAQSRTEEERTEVEKQAATPEGIIKYLQQSRLTPEPLRANTRTAELSGLTPLTIYFDPRKVYKTSEFSTYVQQSGDVDEIHTEMTKRGLTTEFNTQD